jgi:photosystem II stability/assembly factor-like uncharacterized protein
VPEVRGLRSLLACAGIAAAGAAAAAGGFGTPVPVFHGVPHDMLYGLSLEGANAIAVGDFGLVVESSDGGRSWTRQARSPTEKSLLSVARKAGRCIAGGQQGLILIADDCKQWHAAPPVTSARILAVDMNASGIAYAVGGFGTLLRSADWGRNWQVLTPDWKAFSSDGAEPHLYDVQVADNGEATVVGEFEMVLRSRDHGASWSLLHKGRRSLFALKALAGGELYAVGQEGLVLKSPDNGGHWQELDSGSKSILTGIWATADGQVVASGIYTILQSGDGGRSWRLDPSRQARAGWHQALAGSEQGEGRQKVILVGSGGAILALER